MSEPLSSPAASIESATATNLNTQRSGEFAVNGSQADDQNSDASDEAVIDAVSLPSSLSRRQSYNIQPAWADRIDQTKIPARACWLPDQNIDDMLLDIHWSEQHAFLKLSTRLCLKAPPDTPRRVYTNAYIFIYPERIDELSFIQPDEKPFLGSTRAFTLCFNRPPALILPKTNFSLLKEAEDTISSLYSLVQQSHLTIYANLPNSLLSKDWLQKFCKDVTKQKLTTISSCANWEALYRKHGGEAEVIEGDSLLKPIIDHDAAASRPPLYQEIEPRITRSTKRKRSRDESSATGQTVQDITTIQTLIKSVLDAKLAAHERKLEEMYSAHEDKLEEVYSARKRKLEEMYSARERRLKEMLSTRMREVEDLEDGLIERIETMIDAKMTDVRETVLEDVTSMPLQVTLTFPTHSVF